MANAFKGLTFAAGALVAIACLAGCEKRESITRYTVDKPLPLEPLAKADLHANLSAGQGAVGEPTDRTLGAIVPLADQGWFFKLSGPKDAVAAQREAFLAFLKSVSFSGDGKPKWTLPDGWEEREGSDIRYATLVIPGDGKPLEVSVTSLPRTGDEAEYALVNINRWRGQLQLAPIAASELSSQSEQVPLGGATATVVDLEGRATAGGMRAPFMSKGTNGK